MTSRELKKLSRHDLLELLVGIQAENDTLTAKVAELEEQLRERTVNIEKSGSLAEAALLLNGVFRDADRAAEQYKENIRRCSEDQQKIYDRIVSEAEQKAKEILDEAENEKQQKKQEADQYWTYLSGKLEKFYETHAGLREYLLALSNNKQSEADEK